MDTLSVFVTADGDGIGALVGRARQDDDVEEVRRVSRAIEAGNQVFTQWALGSGGSVIEAGGDELAVMVPADRLDELPGVRERYRDVVGATCSVGVGMRLSESSKALLAAKLRGKDQILFYTEDVEKEVREAQSKEPDERQKIITEYLDKAAPAMHQGAFSGATRPTTATPAPPSPTQGDSSEEQALQDVVSGGPPPPERTHAADDFEQQLHDEASRGEEEDQQAAAQGAQTVDQVKQQVAQALQAMKAQAPLLEQVKAQAPGAYQAMQGLVQAVIMMTRQLSPQGLQKSEGGRPDVVHGVQEQVRQVLAPEIQKPEYKGESGCQGGHCHVAAEMMFHSLGGSQGGWTPMVVQQGASPHWYLQHLGSGRVVDPSADQFDTMVPYHKGRPAEFLTPAPSARAQQGLEAMAAQVQKSDRFAMEEVMEKRDLVHYSTTPGLKEIGVDHMGTGAPAQEYRQGKPEVARAYYYQAGTQPEHLVTQGAKAQYRAKLTAKQRLYDLGTDLEGLRAPARERFLAGEGLDSPEDTLLDEVKGRGYHGAFNSASGAPHTVMLFHPHPVREVKKDELDMEKDTASPHHTVVLPVGSQDDNRVKTPTGWRQMSSGMVRGADGLPASSRNPGAGTTPIK